MIIIKLMNNKKILRLFIFGLFAGLSSAQAQTEHLPFNVMIDTMMNSYLNPEPYVKTDILNSKDFRWFKDPNMVDRVKYLFTGKIRLKDLEPFKNTLEYWHINANIPMEGNTVLPALKYIRADQLDGGLKLFDFAKYTPNLEVLIICSTSMMQILPPKLKKIAIWTYDDTWDGRIPDSFFNSPTLEVISISRLQYDEKLGRVYDLPVYLPKLEQDNYTIKHLRGNINISIPDNIDKLTKFRGLEVLGIIFTEVPSEEELKRLSYIDYIIIDDAKISMNQIELLAQRMDKKVIYTGNLDGIILH